MTVRDWQPLIRLLTGVEYQWGVIADDTPRHRIKFDVGLSDEEVDDVEHHFGFRFPPDLRAFLQTALPVSSRFPDWRSGDRKELADRLECVSEGILFDVEQNDLWLAEWGARPDLMQERLSVCGSLLREAPALIPIYGHRFLPSEPNQAGNPVFSVHQSDIIHYGADLDHYLRTEFLTSSPVSPATRPRPIRFWDDLIGGRAWP